MREVAQFNGAQLLFQEERYAEAAEIYEDILEADPTDLMALTNLGAAFVAAGETERANEVFARLRSRDDLTAREFYMIGIGLTQADQLQEAAEVFAEAHARMPQDREALFMQAQALYFWANDQGGDWATLVPVAQRLNELDTHTRLSYTFHFNSLLQTGNGEAAQEVYDRMEALPFEIGGLQLAGVQGGAAVAGIVTNRNAAPGSQARIRVHFYDGSGTSVGTQDATVNLGAAGEAIQFQVDLSTSADVMGYRYEVLS
jgi:tetratricopeptide (TPR) repeat protein